MRTQLVAAFEESLEFVPDPADVLAGMRAGIKRRRRRVRIATAVAAVLVLAAGAVTVGTLRDRVEPPPVGSHPGAQWRNTVAAGWVPGGFTLAERSSGLTTEGLTYFGPGGTITLTVDKHGGNPRLDGDGWHGKEIFGRPGRERTEPGRALVGRQLPSGHWAEVTYERLSGATLTDPELLAAAERVVGSLREDADVPLRVDVAPTYLPSGLRVTGVSAIPSLPGRGAVIGTDDAGNWVTISFGMVNLLSAERIAPIQDRPAYLVDKHTVVVNIYHGAMLSVSSQQLPLDDLIRIADGVRWLG